jgi:GR25 family glycosyltransferase involved in LPS biosynthesis
VERRLERSIIFEDDIHFASDFKHKMADLVKEADRAVPDWDLM